MILPPLCREYQSSAGANKDKISTRNRLKTCKIKTNDQLQQKCFNLEIKVVYKNPEQKIAGFYQIIINLGHLQTNIDYKTKEN